jgi:hypothetical protein
MVKRYYGASPAPYGMYFNFRSAEFIQINEKSRILPGSVEDKYIHLPILIVLILSPLLGLGLIIFLPLAGILVLIYFLACKAGFASSGIGRKIMGTPLP